MKKLKITIIGGSVGGLFLGLALLEKGFVVEIFERSSGTMESRGAGLGIQPDMMEYLIRQKIIDPEAYGIATAIRQTLDRSGKIISVSGQNLSSTSWDYLWRQLKLKFPPGKYLSNYELTKVEQSADGVVAHFRNGIRIKSDLLVGADGYNSVVRQSIMPDIRPAYTGYVAYRGLVPERKLPKKVSKFFHGSFSIFGYPRSHILCYYVPGPAGELSKGKRRLNWVWYVNTDNEQLKKILTDKTNRVREFAIPPGHLTEDVKQMIFRLAENELPEIFQQLVQYTDDPFVQAIADMAVPQMFDRRVAVIGDAAFIVRPHTASGTAKVFRDAVSFADALSNDSEQVELALHKWNRGSIARGVELYEYGKVIARNNGLG